MDQPRKTVWAAVLVAVLAGAMASAHVGKLPPAMPLQAPSPQLADLLAIAPPSEDCT